MGTVCRDLDSQVEALTQERDALQQRVTDFQAGVYGLPEATAEIAMLKEQLTAMDEEKAGAQLFLQGIQLNIALPWLQSQHSDSEYLSACFAQL